MRNKIVRIEIIGNYEKVCYMEVKFRGWLGSTRTKKVACEKDFYNNLIYYVSSGISLGDNLSRVVRNFVNSGDIEHDY